MVKTFVCCQKDKTKRFTSPSGNTCTCCYRNDPRLLQSLAFSHAGSFFFSYHGWLLNSRVAFSAAVHAIESLLQPAAEVTPEYNAQKVKNKVAKSPSDGTLILSFKIYWSEKCCIKSILDAASRLCPNK